MSEPLRLLLVEDDESDAELIRHALGTDGFDLDWERVDSEATLKDSLTRPWDVVISDFAMPGFSGLRAFKLSTAHDPDTPFFFVSGTIGEERAVEAMRAGAKDYFLKGNLARLGAAIRRELREALNRRERKIADQAVLREKRRLALAIEASNVGVFEMSRNGGAGPVDYNGVWSQILGCEIADLPARTDLARAWFAETIHPDDCAVVTERILKFHVGDADRLESEFRLLHRDGHWVDVAVFARAIARAADGTTTHVVGALMNLLARKQLEAQLRQAQKMEAVGQLAGGVAHDFNNLLTAILSFGAFAHEALDTEGPIEAGPIAADVEEMLKAARKAQSLTAQLLAFSRQTAVAPRILNVNEVVVGTERILRRLLEEDIDVLVSLSPDLGNVKIDPDALGQVLLNLAVNARDAMPDGGKLTIDTQNVHLDAEDGIRHGAAVPPGDYIVISNGDSGIGMDAATQARIFEPFFTTKQPGHGTGLGLSTCYGIVKQAQGFIWVYSEIGKGTTFRVYLPRVLGPRDVIAPARDPKGLTGTETVLLVEDDEQVRRLAVRALSRLGYTVIEATNGVEAVAVGRNAETRIDLVLTDVVMPGMGGRQVAEQILSVRPSLTVVYMSGYTPTAIEHRGILDPEAMVLQKPFTPDSLARKVRQALDSRPAAARR